MNHSILKITLAMILYKHKRYQISKTDPYGRGIEGRPFLNFRIHNDQVNSKQRIETEAIQIQKKEPSNLQKAEVT